MNSRRALARLSRSQRIELTVDPNDGHPLAFATLFDRDERTSDNEDGYVNEVEVCDEDDFADVLDRLGVEAK